MKGWRGFMKITASRGTFWKRKRPYANASHIGRIYGRQARPRITPSLTKFICQGRNSHKFLSTCPRQPGPSKQMWSDLQVQVPWRRSLAEGERRRDGMRRLRRCEGAARCAANKGGSPARAQHNGARRKSLRMKTSSESHARLRSGAQHRHFDASTMRWIPHRDISPARRGLGAAQAPAVSARITPR